MRLYLNTVSELLWNSLKRIMAHPEFDSFRLVGGTSLSLQLGHRESVDIDLFTDTTYGSIDFSKIEKALSGIFPYIEFQTIGAVGLWRSYYVGSDESHLLKLDLFYTDPFVFDPILEEGIRMASMEEVIAMKLEVISNGGRKKDFWDIHELLDKFSLEQMLDFYQQRYPYSSSREEIVEKLTDFSKADHDFTPNCFRSKVWELIKLDLEDAVK